MITKVISPRVASPTAINIAHEIGVKRVRSSSAGFDFRGHTVLNWGLSVYITNCIYNCLSNADTIINQPVCVGVASNKADFLDAIGPTFGLESTMDESVVLSWLNDGITVICRETLTGYGGQGIHIIDPDEDEFNIEAILGDCGLFTKYFNGRYEFRVHVGKHSDGSYKPFSIQRKGLAHPEQNNSNSMVRNHENGYVFIRNENVKPESVQQEHFDRMLAACSLAIEIVGLDFAAIDVRMKRNGEFKILEANTAPGLSGTTLEDYARFFRENY